MRYFNRRSFKKFDRTISLSVLLSCILVFAAACIESSGPLGAPNVLEVGSVSSVNVSLAQPTLALGQSTQATVIAKTADGHVVSGPVDFSSQNPTVATVSSNGVVSALTAGVTQIRATVLSRVASASLTVVQVPGDAPTSGVLAHHDFNDGSPGPLTVSSGVKVDFPNDPTVSGRGKVARILYGPIEANRSDEEYVGYIAHDNARIRYGRTIWFKGEVYLPSNPLNDPNWRASDLRKLLDWQGSSDDGWTGGGARWILEKSFDAQTNQPCLTVIVERQTTINGIHQPNTLQFAGQFGQDKIDFDRWHTIEVRLITNSANGVADGSLAFWLDNSSDTPTFETPATLDFINESWAPRGFDGQLKVGSYFSALLVGSQLSNATPLPLNQEYRYWDNLTFSTQRVGR